MHRLGLVAFVTLVHLTGVVAADVAPRTIAARVNGEPVYTAEVEAEIRRVKAGREISEGERKDLFQATLDVLIDRRLILANLKKAGQAASAQDVDLALAQFQKDLQSQNLTLEQHLQQVGLVAEDVRRALAWKLSWQRYLEKQLTEQNLEKYFQRYRRDFDGTQLRVAQILWKVAADADEAALANVKERATHVKQEIAAGKLSFAAAARQHSAAPSSQDGGDLGWIERHKPMPEDFSKAAYALKVGEVSEPLVTVFGVHLLTILEEQPGTKTWREAQAELRPAVTLYLFRWIADTERRAAKIES